MWTWSHLLNGNKKWIDSRLQVAACVHLNWVPKTTNQESLKTNWSYAVFSITQLGQLESFIHLFGRRRLDAQSKIQINSCPIPRNSRSWTFTVNPPSETLHSNFSSKPCIMKIFLYAPTLKLFFSVINHSHKLVRSRLVPCFFFFCFFLLGFVEVNKCY